MKRLQKGIFVVLDEVWGMPSVPGALLQAKLSIALRRSVRVGSAFSSSMMGRGSMALRAEVTTVFSLE